MQRIEVKSSLLQAIEYDSESKTLIVQFKPKSEGEEGAMYRYHNVSPETYAKFRDAPSLGKHFLKEIKPAHACTKLGEDKKDAKSKKKGSTPFKTSEPDEPAPF